MAATSQKGRDQRTGASREAKSEWWGNAAKGSTPGVKWWDDAPSVRSKMKIGPANMLPARKPWEGGGNQQGGVEATEGGEPALQGNASGKRIL